MTDWDGVIGWVEAKLEMRGHGPVGLEEACGGSLDKRWKGREREVFHLNAVESREHSSFVTGLPPRHVGVGPMCKFNNFLMPQSSDHTERDFDTTKKGEAARKTRSGVGDKITLNKTSPSCPHRSLRRVSFFLLLPSSPFLFLGALAQCVRFLQDTVWQAKWCVRLGPAYRLASMQQILSLAIHSSLAEVILSKVLRQYSTRTNPSY